MEVGRWGTKGLATFACLAALTGTAFAEDGSLFSGPTLRETGRIGGMTVDAPLPTPNPGEVSLNGRTEKSAVSAAASLEDPRVPPKGLVNQRILQREIDAHFAGLEGCRISVARLKQVHPSQLTADNLLLRWRIETSGTITTTDVVATSPVDMDLMNCVKRSMSGWTFTPPRGGTVDLERTYTFKKMREPTSGPAPASTEAIPDVPAASSDAVEPGDSQP